MNNDDSHVKSCVMFGRGKLQNGVLIQPAEDFVFDPKDVKKLEGVVTTNSASLAEITEDLQALEEELEECVQYVEEIRSKVADAQTAAENSKDDLDNLKAELEEKTEQIQAFRAKEVSSISRQSFLYSNDWFL